MLHANFLLEQMGNDCLNVGQLLGSLLRILAHKGRQDHTQSGDKELHVLSPVVIDGGSVKD